MIVVTVSRLLGTHGEEIARKVADEIAIPYVDREIVHETATRAGVSEEALKDVDERRPSLLTRMAGIILGYPIDEEMGYPIASIHSMPILTPENFRTLIEDVIVEIADRGSAVIVGRGAHLILRNRPNILRVQVYAPFEVRVGRVAVQQGLDKKAAEKVVRDSDRNRAGYMQAYFGVDWREPSQYDLMINTGKISDGLAISMVVSAANMIASRT